MELFYIIGLMVFLTFVLKRAFRSSGSSKKKGKRGEKLVSNELKRMNLEAFHDVLLPSRDGMTQIDHIAKVGNSIVVIETKNYKGAIYGGRWDKDWRQVFRRGSSFPFKNPINQNYGHIKAVQAVVGGDVDVRGVVVFVGTAKFPKGRPEGVLTMFEFADWLRETFVDAGAKTNIDQAWAELLDEMKLRGGRADRKEHMRTVKNAKSGTRTVSPDQRMEPTFD